MARPSSKIMTSADKKVAIAGLKTAIKQQNESVKTLDSELKTAQKAFAAVEKSVNAELKAASKTFDLAAKTADKTMAAAQKNLDAAIKKHGKFSGAAAVGTAKLSEKMSALEATPTEKAELKSKKDAPALM